MIYSSRHGFLLVEVPYTGSAVLREAFGRYGNRPGWRSAVAGALSGICPPLGRAGLYQWRTFREFLPLRDVQGVLPPEEFAQCFKFGFVRHPYDRVILMYQMMVGDAGHPRHRMVASYRDFAVFVENLAWIGEPSMTSYWQASGGAVSADFVGKMENFEEDFDTVCRRLGVQEQAARAVAAAGYRAGYQPITDLVRTALGRDEVYAWNRSDVALGQAAAHLRADYTPELRAEVFEYYREDFENFGYGKDRAED